MKFVSATVIVLAAIAAGWLWARKTSATPVPARVSAQPAPAIVAVSPARIPTSTPPTPAVKREVANSTHEESLRQLAAQKAAVDINGALTWIKSLSPTDQAIAIEGALAQVGQSDPAGAIALALAFQVGVNDGRIEHFAQLWTEEHPVEAAAWITAQPPGETRDRLLARSARVRAAREAAEAIQMVGLMSAGSNRDAALAEVVQQWKLYDPAAAAEALARFPALQADSGPR